MRLKYSGLAAYHWVRSVTRFVSKSGIEYPLRMRSHRSLGKLSVATLSRLALPLAMGLRSSGGVGLVLA